MTGEMLISFSPLLARLGGFGTLEQAPGIRGVPTRVHECDVIGAMLYWLLTHAST
jgi:hypothetical protein